MGIFTITMHFAETCSFEMELHAVHNCTTLLHVSEESAKELTMLRQQLKVEDDENKN
jgi:hypothetical protein